VIVASDSEEAKGKLMKDAAAAIEDNKDVAILGIQIGRDDFGHEQEKRGGLPTQSWGQETVFFQFENETPHQLQVVERHD
jgi:hypothetical protein